ncbi:MAG: serine/threonine protein kinase [Planctomycetota bacterium]|jgi:serine/threonine protein kinase
MSVELDKRVLELFHLVAELSADERKHRLEELTQDQPDIRERVLELLDAGGETSEFMLQPALGSDFRLSLHYKAHGQFGGEGAGGQAHHPKEIGPYRIEGVLGEGGMGIVYRAEQQQPQRSVALKVLRPGMADARFRRHFEREARALGRLKHPGIAQIYEAGTAAMAIGPTPFLAMEFIEGRSLSDWVREEEPDLRTRVQVLIEICEAVQHAHQKSVVHLDLKPGNVLVTAEGRVKVLDFGLARLTDEERTNAGDSRQSNVIVGTLAYMSPEQLGADPDAIDSSSDIYALGATTFEVLAGKPPHDLKGLSLTAALRRVTQDVPLDLSVESPHLGKDLSAIVRKAMSPAPDDRYQSAMGLAEEFIRWGKHIPVHARRASTPERLGKFVRRNRALVLGVSAFVLTLTGIITTAWQANEARAEAKNSNDLSAFMKIMLVAAGDVRIDGTPKEVSDVLDRAHSTFNSQFRGNRSNPKVSGEIANMLGLAFLDIGHFEKACELVSQALDLRQSVFDDNHPDVLKSLNDLGIAQIGVREFKKAEENLRMAFEGRLRVLGDDNLDTVRSASWLGHVLLQREDPREAGILLEHAWRASERLVGIEAPETLSTLKNLAQYWIREGKIDLALKTLIQVSETERARGRSDELGLYHTLNNISVILMDRGEYHEAEKVVVEALAGYTRLRGSDHALTLAINGNLRTIRGETIGPAAGIAGEGSTESADDSKQDEGSGSGEGAPMSEADDAEISDLRQPQYYALMISAASNKFYLGMLDEAEADILKAIDGLERHEGQERYLHPARQSLAGIYYERGHFGSSIALLRENISKHVKFGTDGSAYCLMARSSLANSLRATGRLDEALALLRETSKALAEKTGEDSLYALSARSNLATTLLDNGDNEVALEISDGVVAAAFTKLGTGHAFPHVFSIPLGRALLKLQRFKEAEEVLLSAHEGLLRLHTANGPYTRRAVTAIADLYEAWGKPTASVVWRSMLSASPTEAIEALAPK